MTTLGLLKLLRESQGWEQCEQGHRYKFRNDSAGFFISFTASTDPMEKVHFESQDASLTVKAHALNAVTDLKGTSFFISEWAVPFFRFDLMGGKGEKAEE